MNLSGPLSHVHVCESCGGEGSREQMSEEHIGLCIPCATSLQAELDAEAAEELLSDDGIFEALLAEAV